MSYKIVVPVQNANGPLNGVTVDAYAVSRFPNDNVPLEDSNAPDSNPPDATAVTATDGAPGQAILYVTNQGAYNVRVTYAGHYYWTQSVAAVPGPQGFQGHQGFQGVQGTQGYQGTQGIYIGSSAPSDTNVLWDDTSTSGIIGIQGPQGYQGSQGNQGSQGSQGNQGNQGSQGSQGYQGYQGPGDTYQTTSTTSLSIGTGTKTLTVGTKLAYSVSQSVLVANDSSHSMVGTVTSYDKVSGSLVLNVTTTVGTGTFASWNVNLNGAVGAVGAQGSQGETGAQGVKGDQGNQGNQGAPSTIQGPQGYQGSEGPQGSVPTNLFITYGPQAPSSATYQSVPVVWIDTSTVLTPIPVQPLVPVWDDANSQFTVPSGLVGLDYVWTSGGGGTGQTLTQGVTYSTSGTFPRRVTLTPVAQAGYVLASPSQVFIHDFSDPSVSTVITSDTFTGSPASTLVGRLTDAQSGGTPQKWVYDLGGTDFTHLTSAGSTGSFITTSDPNNTMEYAPYVTGDNRVALRFLNAPNIKAQFQLLNLPVNTSTNNPLTIALGRRVNSTISASDGNSFVGITLNMGYNRFRITTTSATSGNVDLQFGLGVVPQLGVYTVTMVGTTITIYQPDNSVLSYDLSNSGIYKFPVTTGFTESRFYAAMTHGYASNLGVLTSGLTSGSPVSTINVLQNNYTAGILANSVVTVKQGAATQNFTVATTVPQGTLSVPVVTANANANYFVPTVIVNGSLSMGTLSTALVKNASVTALNVTSNPSTSIIPANATVVVSQGSSSQTFVVKSNVAVGALIIPVNAVTANDDFGTSITGESVVPANQFIENLKIIKMGA